jgi:sialic acid synthase SpsE
MTLLRDGVTIIAEIGSNHDGELDKAFRLIDVAAECGADVVKFQSFLVDDLLAADDPNYDRLRRLQVPRDWYPKLMARCQSRNLAFLSTATNFTTLGWMEGLGVHGYKVASCNITHRPLLRRLVEIGKPVIVSTGMATLDEVMALRRWFEGLDFHAFAFLHCIARYPTPAEDMNLGNIRVLRRVLPCPVGLSDHSHSTVIPALAVALGARIIEKHISLDRGGIGLDHEVAVLPDDFAAMCRNIREAEAAVRIDFTPERAVMARMRRSLRFARDLEAGCVVAEADLKVTRPEDGLPPDTLDRLIGRRLTRAVAANQPAQWDLFEGGEA